MPSFAFLRAFVVGNGETRIQARSSEASAHSSVLRASVVPSAPGGRTSKRQAHAHGCAGGMADPVALIQATLAPIFLVNGAAIFLNFTQARLFRVVDRLRALGKELDLAVGAARGPLQRDVRRHARRAVILRNAILMGVLVIACTVLTTLLILLPAEFGFAGAGLPVVALTAALLCFMAALTLVTVDAFMSVATAREAAEGPR